MTSRTRTTSTPAQRAQDRVNILQRRKTKLANSRANAAQALEDLDTQIKANNTRLDYALADPDLPEQQPNEKGTTNE